jgi:hypothetical protein
MDDLDSGRVSKPTTHHQPPPTTHQHNHNHNKNRRVKNTSPWPQLLHLRPPPYINAQTCHRSIRCSQRLWSKKMAFQSHPPLASYVAGSILHRPVVTAPPVTLKQPPASPFPDVGMLQTPPPSETPKIWYGQ